MDRINCPASECWQRLSSGEERDLDVCAMHINATIEYADSIENRLCRCIDETNSTPEQQRAYKHVLWFERGNMKKIENLSDIEDCKDCPLSEGECKGVTSDGSGMAKRT